MGQLGDILRQARENKGITLDQVEKETKVKARYLQAMEIEDFKAFPSPVHGRGFLRNYALFLGLNPEEICALYPEEVRPRRLEEPVALPKPSPGIGGWLMAFAVLAVLASIGYYLYGQSRMLSSSQKETAAELSTPLPTAVIPPSPTATPKPLPQKVEIQVRAVQRSWVTVEVDSAPIFTGTLEIGDKKTWVGEERVYMRTGNAGGLEITLNGEYRGLLGKPGEVLDMNWGKGEIKLVETPLPTSLVVQYDRHGRS
ncbi:MAG: helix-turn-helix domain-containing protein [Chloroflexi bacterium]|nr:helix-turn-helix domain-containing protein [Chloroflexota bacterium]